MEIHDHGFDCEFVDQTPTKFLQLECPVCLKVLRVPYQAPCCGKSFCQVCIDKVKRNSEYTCPTCNTANFDVFHNKGLQSTLYGLEVYCSHREKGCQWRGQLSQLSNHLSRTPQPDQPLDVERCEYSEIKCIYCSEMIKCRNITIHQSDLCPMRPFSCDYCQDYESHYEDVTNCHWPVCGFYPVECPNECGIFLQRQDVENHFAKDCPNEPIHCDFYHVGCEMRLPRKDIPAHLEEKLVTHMSLQAASHKELQSSHSELCTKHATLQSHYDTLVSRVSDLEEVQQDLGTTIPMPDTRVSSVSINLEKVQQDLNNLGATFTMPNFEEKKKRSSVWYSPPFYSDSRGYKFCISVYANSASKQSSDVYGKYVSVYAHLMQGEFDQFLDWPFKGVVRIALLSQCDSKHCVKDVIYKGNFVYRGDRVTQGVRGIKRGHFNFVSQCSVRKYLRNNSLSFACKVLKS